MTIDAARRQQYLLIQEHKAPRRVQLADDVTILFESETTIDHQVAEMLWMEEDAEARAAIHEGYADLMPTTDRITATVSIEVKDVATIKPRLGYYAGLEHCFTLIGGDAVVKARIIGDHGTDIATTAVTYLAFDLPPGFEREGAVLDVDHPRLRCEVPLPAAVIQAPL